MATMDRNVGGHIHSQLTRSLEKILDDAHQSGELKLTNRKLKDFPKITEKYNLSDTVIADLSKNRFSELPEEVTSFHFLEKLHCYHNAIRYIPDAVVNLQCLMYLDLSRNQLGSLPRELCQLPIKILLVSNNNLAYLPDELSRMSQLTELDASCNQLTHLPPRMSDLRSLQSLVVRNNLLLAVPIELTSLNLARLDLRANRISVLPIEVKDMSCLIDLTVDDNPLTSPPASLCRRGRVHIFKYLENEAARFDKKAGGTLGRKPRKVNSPGPPLLKYKRQNVDSGYSTSSDGFEKRWSQELGGGEEKGWTSTPILNGTTGSPAPEDVSESFGIVNGNEVEAKPLQQIQTYREYKEALKQQRAQDVPSIYRTKDPDDHSNKTEPNTPTHHPSHTSLATSKSDPTPLNSALSKRCHFNGNSYVKPQSPIKSDNVPNGTKLSPYMNGNGVKVNRNITWNKDIPPEKMTFTMRREIDKAREESDLINQLRNIIECRLKMTLPEDLAAALTDGVVLCHLANHIKPRSVASIHVPSPAVPKLTMARCRRNVDNFIEACRKIGVDEGRLCGSLDVTEALPGRGLPRLLDTVTALCEISDKQKKATPHDVTVSLLLLSLFFATVSLLVAFPPPN